MVRFMVLALAVGCSRDKDELPVNLGPWLDPEPPVLEDLDPDPMIFEANLTASETTWTYAPGATVRGLSYGGSVPGPLIRAPLGARVIVHFTNDLPASFDTTIHWHGIEGNNASDGTHVTQTSIMAGERFDYSFVVTRPGLYWYHPHARGAQGVFEGLYAPLIVDDPDEAALVEMGVLPEDERVMVLSDISEFDSTPLSAEVDNAMEIMNGTEGKHLLVNGREDPIFEIAAGEAVRLRLVNTSITRFWRLSVPGRTLYRVGGEGGLLDAVRVEGGVIRGEALDETGAVAGPADIDLGYERGEILLAPAERADVVLVADGAPGDVLQLRWEDYARGRHGMWMEGDEMVMGDMDDDGQRPGETVATFRLIEGSGSTPTLTEGAPILAAVGRAVGRVDTSTALQWTEGAAMVLSERMDMWENADGIWEMSTELYVDGQSWMPEHMAGRDQPEAPTAVHARLGDTLLWEVRNDSGMSHPLHIHGFSYQPLAFTRTDEETGATVRWELDYDEFEDTTLIPGHSSLWLAMHIEDPVGDGGALGRWMRHCHILQHGENGMMSELVVDP